MRKVCGPVTEEGFWRIINEETRELYKTLNLVADIKKGRLQWLGHVIKMDQTTGAKKNV
jgi:hypothetical protein